MKTALKTDNTSVRLQERADVVARTVMSQQAFYQSDQCSSNQRQLPKTMVGSLQLATGISNSIQSVQHLNHVSILIIFFQAWRAER